MSGRTCSSCRSPLDPTDKFCRNCGATVAPPPGQPGFAAPYQSPVLSPLPIDVPSRQEFLEFDDTEHTLAAGYSPPLAPLPVLPEIPPFDPSAQDVPDTLAAGYRAPAYPQTSIRAPIGAPSHYGAQSGRCPRCGLNLPIYREKCPNCGATVMPLGETIVAAPDGARARINVPTYGLTKSPVADFFIGIGVFFLLYCTRFLGFDFAPLILIPVTWMFSRLFWRWFAHGLGLMTLISLAVLTYLVVVHFQQHPMQIPTVNDSQ